MHARAESIYLRRTRRGPVEQLASVRAVVGFGFQGEWHSDPLSLRQVLIAGAPTYREMGLPPNALGENLFLNIDVADIAPGTVLAVGSEVQLWLTFPCEPCGYLDTYRTGLSAEIGARRGMLSRVIRGGQLSVNDEVRDLGICMPAWSADWRQRIRQVLTAVPAGAVVEYSALARLAGVQSSYCRAFPKILRSFGEGYVNKAVPAKSLDVRPRYLGEKLFDFVPGCSTYR